ncbi:hypothetical protein [Pectinatus brassicae]|uniref:Putative nucleic acid-binding Zn-ribbon protein n=1 Tax=Pectinatus brassicae TaxID=862415 RepID=A0A840US18_9FIRM|nr:hypothetical protein [Pectinatus brassicae]MBB5335634.1 putative nucleic acid-binding Zn-ribbon protein [Pectinatus brassicae]
MNYLPILTEAEIKYICSVIYIQDSVWYFKRYPKDFAKIMPGFRPTSLKNQEQVSALLYRSRNQAFISSFIEKHISRWLDEIQDEITLKTDKGESKESAWMQTLPFCFFVDNISIFFKLIGDEQPEQYVSLISASIKRIRDLDISHKRIKTTLSNKKSEVMRLEDDIRCVQSELDKSSKKLIEHSSEIKALKRTCADIEKLEGIVCAREQELDILKKKAQERDEYIQKLNDELSASKDAQLQLEIKIKEEIKQQRIAESIEQAASLKPRGPKDIEEFKEFLEYNLESLGVATNAEYYFLLKEHICKILFQGKPIIICRAAGMVLMRCVANTLVGSANVDTLSFVTDISEQQIHGFLSTKNRIVCLDNFIGNYNETTLLTICDKHRNKIIFLTTVYERTLFYIPEELLKYCIYLNLNRIEGFTHDHALTEAPSTIDEIDASYPTITPDIRWSSLLKEILDELGVCSALSTYKSSLISNEASLCCLLAFDVLPFCVDVLKISPFSVSERLNKYAGDKGRCSHKGLFKRWFV